jgi:N-acetylglucosamine-6-phosphate deacetylase
VRSPLLDLVVLGDRIYRDGTFVSGWFATRGDRIAGRGEGTPPAAREVLDARGLHVVPGLVDLHVHGAGGGDASAEDAGEMGAMARALAGLGTTAFQATLYPASVDTLVRRLAAIVARRPEAGEARLIGVHLEGPFVNRRRSGALDPRSLGPPRPRDVARLLEAGAGCLRTVTIAPELQGGTDAIREFARAGVRVSLGHSDATWEEAGRGVAAGARSVTHLFNAMRPFHHREAGLAGRALLDPALACELIGDLAHVSPPAVDLALAAKGVEGLLLVSDGVRPTGTKARSFSAGGRRHRVKGGVATTGNGVLAGACLPLLDGVVRLVGARRLSLADAIRLAATNPAAASGAAGTLGDLRVGARADFLWCDGEGRLKRAFLAGQAVAGVSTQRRG